MQTEYTPYVLTHIYRSTQLLAYIRVWPLLCFFSGSIPRCRGDVLGLLPHAHLPGRAGLPQEPGKQRCRKPRQRSRLLAASGAAAGPAQSTAPRRHHSPTDAAAFRAAPTCRKILVGEITSGIGRLLRRVHGTELRAPRSESEGTCARVGASSFPVLQHLPRRGCPQQDTSERERPPCCSSLHQLPGPGFSVPTGLSIGIWQPCFWGRMRDQQLGWLQSLSLQISVSESLAEAGEQYRELSKKQFSKGIRLIVLVPVCLNLPAYLHAMLTQSPRLGKAPTSQKSAVRRAALRSPSLHSACRRTQGDQPSLQLALSPGETGPLCWLPSGDAQLSPS